MKYNLKKVVKNIYSSFHARKVLKIFPYVSFDEYLNQLNDIKAIDRNMIGRYCGSLEDKIMQTMSCYNVALKFPSNKKYAHVEIGVLFGGSVLAKLSVLKRLGMEQSIIAIDTFRGFYQQSRDPITNLEVTEENFLKNIRKFGFNAQMLKIVKRCSTDKIVKQYLSGYKVISLMIDGDHSYDGVCGDWERYSDLVEAGGCVIFDDYGDSDWPDVTKFVDELVNSKPRGWQVLGKLDTTLVMQRS